MSALVRYLAAIYHLGPRQDPSYVASSVARQLALIEAGRTPPVIEMGNLETRRDLTDVRDTVRAYRRIAEHGRAGAIYNVCSGEAVAMRELVRKMVTRVGLPVEIRTNPALLRPKDTPLMLGSPRRIRQELGWAPDIPLDRTLDDLLEYWRRQVAA